MRDALSGVAAPHRPIPGPLYIVSFSLSWHWKIYKANLDGPSKSNPGQLSIVNFLLHHFIYLFEICRSVLREEGFQSNVKV